TGVAGILGGRKLGASKGVTIKSVKVLSNTSGSVSTAISGIQWAVQDWTNNSTGNALTAILNASFGTTDSVSLTLNAAFASAYQANIFPVIASGNSAIDACTLSPQSAGVGLVVGSISYTKDYQSSFSNYGGCVDIFAPGEKIIYPRSGTFDQYFNGAGTSFSAPFVSGIAALYVEKNSQSTPDQIKQYLLSKALPRVTRVSKNTTNLLLNYQG
ncbi:Extracellular serine proteinase, partial [Smittium mucronatum]